MRKTFAILLIALVALSAVCATTESESHTIVLTSVVAEQDPAFQLQLGASAVTNDGVTVFADNAEYPPVENAISVDVADISAEDIDVKFEVKLATAAKIRKAFTITFTPGSFSVTRSGTAGTIAPSTEANKTYLVAKTGLTGVSVLSGDGYSATVTFNGTTCTAGTVLADFHLFYGQDSTVDPNSEGYTATVTLEITTEA